MHRLTLLQALLGCDPVARRYLHSTPSQVHHIDHQAVESISLYIDKVNRAGCILLVFHDLEGTGILAMDYGSLGSLSDAWKDTSRHYLLNCSPILSRANGLAAVPGGMAEGSRLLRNASLTLRLATPEFNSSH